MLMQGCQRFSVVYNKLEPGVIEGTVVENNSKFAVSQWRFLVKIQIWYFAVSIFVVFMQNMTK